ncbi:biotin--protein ligase [Nasonia vitripennis]|uniref:BPL/LPL catalytic domain-containing protein n=1 Tax=Nasonia vitripennis TaxID=7425 RepID=A0A7M7G5Q3_NASVI|nr:biotin--protein ligase [Nasonia vitripennis]XP_008209083.1 biotin--protein ligase [Nasonia vitripennis]
MLLTIFYMVATWVQSWRLSSLRARLQAILLGPEATRPSIMLYTASQLSVKDETNGNKSKLQNGNNISKDMLSSHLCSNSNLAKLGDLLWYQGDKRLCTIYPQQKVDVSHWLLYPYGKTVFPLFAHNNAQATLQQNAKMHVLIEADLSNYIPLASSKATKLEDYGIIVTWMFKDNFGVILETDLEHITKFSTTLMQGQCFINNGLPVTRIESVSVTGKPCICNYERFNLVESRKLIGSSQWNTYVKKLRLVSSTARLVSQQNEAIEIKEIPGLIVSPGSKPITLQMPTILEIKIPNDETDDHINSSVPSTPPPTPASATAVINGTASRLSQALTNSMDLSVGSLSNLSSSRSQEFVLEESSQENLSKFTPLISVNNTKRTSDRDSKMSSVMSSKSSLSAVNYSPRKTELDSKVTKPPNILICADSAVASDNVRSVLDSILKENKYTVYPLSAQEARKDVWMDQASLMIVCGNVGNDVASKVVEFLVHGGKLLALCSDILKTLLPTFKTAEVRENELVRFSYGKWKHVRMMHHVFCYQASPVKTKFSQDLEDSKQVTPPTPVSATINDRSGKSHTFNVKVLGSEETWHTPSILLANLPESGGKAVFSQIHLEADPSQYEFEESKFLALKQSNATRLEIFSDLLKTHLDIEVYAKPMIPPTYSSGFFLGRHELKLEMLKKLKDKMQPNDVLKTTNLEIQFCGTSTVPKPASSTYLPVMVHRCPDNFSTVEYFENLSTEALGRLVIYADVMTSSNAAINGFALHHGLAVICRSQTKGEGRGKNVWLSPEGCAMFSLQIHIPFNSILGERISLIQHITSVAVVSAIRSIPDYQDIDIRIKWPNDVYTGNGSKLGGTTVTSTIQSPTIICNLGTGINLSNSSPTTCINDMITKYNQATGKKLEKITLERFVALVFNEMEKLINLIQNNNMDEFYDIYYGYWMHTDAEITVILPDGSSQEVKILGIDDYGFLEVQGKNGNIFTVHPDGNSFDILSGLVAPKC